jgi:hypothetical protein
VTVTSFWSDLRGRAEHTLLLVAKSASALGFIVAFVTGATWLSRRGYVRVADALALLYVMVSLPIFLAQVGVILDLLLAFIGEASTIVPLLTSVADRVTIGPVIRVFAGFLTTVSLFSSLSTWALSLLMRRASARELARMKYHAEAGLFAATLARIRRRA